ncbi:MAG: membrane protein insertion efficiency factor YidD [Terriglobales bacterium]
MTNWGKIVVLGCLRGYQRAISPWLPPACRFYPTCSEYAVEAVDRYGVLIGAALAAWRLLRCHPLHPGGFDPVPERRHHHA